MFCTDKYLSRCLLLVSSALCNSTILGILSILLIIMGFNFVMRNWQPAKGQLISKENFKVFIWTKKPTKIFSYFCPNFIKPLKSGRKKTYKTNLTLFIIYLSYFFLIWPLLEASRAEIQKHYRCFFGSNEKFRICFRD